MNTQSKSTIDSLVHDYIAAINNLDVNAYLANFADNAIAHEPVGTPAFVGHEGIRQFFENTGGLFASIHMQSSFVHVVGNEAAIKWTIQGTGKNSKSVTFEGIDLWKFNDANKIQTLNAYWNPEPVVAELTS
jgi:steroid Delta-isomerase